MFEVWDGLQDTQMSISVDANQYVGSAPVWRIVGAEPNALISWTSVQNGQNTGENNDYGQMTTADGTWTQTGGAWETKHIGNWTKTAFVNGKSASVSFNVSPAPTPAPTPGPTPGPTPIPPPGTTMTSDDVLTWIKNNALYLGLGAAALLVLPSLLGNFGGGQKRGR